MFPELSTNRFLLLEIIPEDQPFIYEGLSHPEVIPYYGIRYESLESTKRQMIFYRELYDQHTGLWWKIVEKETGSKVGAIGFNNWNHVHQKAELGYWLLPRYWKKGIITEVIPQVVEYMLQQKDIHRIEALVEAPNLRSARVLERSGFTYEGTMRDCEYKDQRFISLKIYSLLSTDKLHSYI